MDERFVIMDNEIATVYESRKTMGIKDFAALLTLGENKLNCCLPYGTIGFDYIKNDKEERIDFITIIEPKIGNMSISLPYRELIEGKTRSDWNSTKSRRMATRRRWEFPTLVFHTCYGFFKNSNDVRIGKTLSCQVYHLPNPNNERLDELLLSEKLPLYKVPFPNIGSENKICVGHSGYVHNNPMASINDFYVSRFNSDLMDNIRNSLTHQPIDETSIDKKNPEGIVTSRSIALTLKDIIMNRDKYFNAGAKENLVRIATLYPKGIMINDKNEFDMIKKYTDEEREADNIAEMEANKNKGGDNKDGSDNKITKTRAMVTREGEVTIRRI